MKRVPIPNELIEEEAIRIIQKELPINHCQEFIKKASTEASYDGYINYFKNRSANNKEGIMPIPVQVKGTTESYKKNHYDCDVSDLKNYSSSGVCYFVVKIKYNDDYSSVVSYRILAKSIVGVEALQLLEGKEKQKTIRVELNEICNEKDFVNLFDAHKTKQETVTLHSYVDLFKTKSGTVSLLGEDNKYTSTPAVGKQYFATFNANGNISFAHNFRIEWSIVRINDEVKVKDKLFFNVYEKQENEKGKSFIVFNNALCLEIVDVGFKVILNQYALVDEYVDALEFLYAAMDNKTFTIGGLNVPVLNNEETANKMVSMYYNLLIFAKTIRGFIRSVGYEKPFSIMDLNKNDINTIALMYTKFNDNSVDYTLVSISLFTRMVARIMSKGQILFLNIFDPNLYMAVKFKYNNDPRKKTTPFIRISIEQWEKMDLAEQEVFENIIKKHVTLEKDVTWDYRLVVRNLILAYKNTNRGKLFSYASFLNDYFVFHFNLQRLLKDID